MGRWDFILLFFEQNRQSGVTLYIMNAPLMIALMKNALLPAVCLMSLAVLSPAAETGGETGAAEAVHARDAQGRTPLHRAAELGDAAQCRALLEAGAHYWERDVHGDAPLHLAARGGHVETCRLLAEQGEHSLYVNPTNARGELPLHVAARGGFGEVCELLIAAGSDLGVRDSAGNTPLHAAAVGGVGCCVPMLLTQGGTDLLQQKNAEGQVPADVATDETAKEVLRAAESGELTMLLSKLAVPVDPLPHTQETLRRLRQEEERRCRACWHEMMMHYWRYLNGREPLSAYPYIYTLVSLMNAEGPDEATLRELVEAGADGNAVVEENAASDKTGSTALLLVVSQGRVGMCRRLLSAGVSPNGADKVGNTPLHLAVRAEQHALALTQLLIDAEADVNIKNADGATPYDCCTDFSEEAALIRRELVLAGARPGGVPPLVLAAAQNNAGACERLIAQGDDVNRTDSHGFTALHWAAGLGNVELCRKLLDAGADATRCHNYGHTALCWAAAQQKIEVCRALLDAGVSPRCGNNCSALHHAAFMGLASVCVALLEAQDADDRIAHGKTPLMQAAAFSAPGGFYRVCQALISAGADVNARDEFGSTALHYAMMSGRNPESVSKVKALLAAGADVDAATSRGDTPLHYAVIFNRPDMCRMLIHAGASCTVRSRSDMFGKVRGVELAPEGYTALEMAELLARVDPANVAPAYGQVGVAELLRAAEAGKRLPVWVLQRCRGEVRAAADRFEDEGLLPNYPYVARLVRCCPEVLVLPSLREIILEGVDVNERDAHDGYRTALHIAAEQGDVRLCRLLLEAGADASLRDAESMTPLDLARRAHRDEVVELLTDNLMDSGLKD